MCADVWIECGKHCRCCALKLLYSQIWHKFLVATQAVTIRRWWRWFCRKIATFSKWWKFSTKFSMGVHNLFQSEYITHSCFNLCLKNLQERKTSKKRWTDRRRAVDEKNYELLLDSHWMQSKKSEEMKRMMPENMYVICSSPLEFVPHLSSFFFLFGVTPNFCSFFDLLLLKGTALSVYVSIVSYLHCIHITYHICPCVYVCALLKQMCFSVKMCVGICRVSRFHDNRLRW